MQDLVQCFWPGALTLVVNQQPTLIWDLGDTSGTVAIRMPMHSAAIELLNLVGPMAVSSANKTEQSPALNIQMASEQLGESVSVFLDGGTTLKTIASTILDLTGEKVRVIRLGALGLDEIREVIPDVIPPDGVNNE
jgi:tRNA threonylcarbamoyl adenosine modification protein (Sua5/YciO/YrdC/YwlC family)